MPSAAEVCFDPPDRLARSGLRGRLGVSGLVLAGFLPYFKPRTHLFRIPAVPDGDVPDTEFACALEGIARVSFDPVGSADVRQHWEAMMKVHHTLG